MLTLSTTLTFILKGISASLRGFYKASFLSVTLSPSLPLSLSLSLSLSLFLGISSSLGGFSKASFVSADQNEDVDINDPDFWKKAIGLTEMHGGDEDLLFEDGVGRTRRQIKVYGGEEFDDEHFPDSNETKKERKERMEKEKKEKDLSEKKEKAREGKEKKERELSERKEKVKLLKEKKEKEREDKVKVAFELREKREAADRKDRRIDIKLWGSHARDRVLRALCSYGFTRWEKVREDSGGCVRSLEDIESFCRSFVLRCGLTTSDQEITKNDSDFVRESIMVARRVEGEVIAGTRTLDIPPCLSDDKFLNKMKG
jgi:hypothetical protein